MKCQFIARKMLKRQQEDSREKELPSLRQLATQTIAKNFEKYSSLDAITSTQILEEIYAKIDLCEVSIVLLAKSIVSEEFWKRACSEIFYVLDSNFLQGANGRTGIQPSSKELFFEIYFKRIIHESSIDADFMLQMAQVAGHLVRRWSIEEVAERLDKAVFESLIYMENLESLSVSFACPLQELNFGINAYRGLNLERAEMLSANGKFANLQTLKLENNMMSEKVLKIILKSLKSCKQLHSLSIAHNKLADAGMQTICHWLKKHQEVPVKNLDVSDNEVGYEGGRIVAQLLGNTDCQLESVNLKINFLNNDVLIDLLEKLAKNDKSKLRSINLSSNLFKDNIISNLRLFFTENKILEEIILDGNELTISEEDVAPLQLALTKNTSLKRFSLKFNKIDAEKLAKIQKCK